MTIIYNKTPTTVTRQIEMLLERGMQIRNKLYCEKCLAHVSYYKLRGYWLSFELNPLDGTHRFKNGTYLDDILSLYNLDFKLRAFMFKIISELEINIKAQFVELSNVIDVTHLNNNTPLSHFYISSSLFNEKSFCSNISNIKNEYDKNKSKLIFIESYKQKYHYPYLPPVWSAVELMSLGDIAKWLRSISDSRYSNFIPNKLNWSKPEFDNFMFKTTIVRNICAHHGRLFDNKVYGNNIYNQHIRYLLSSRDHKLWNTFIMVLHVLSKFDSTNIKEYKLELCEMLNNYEKFLLFYGFPKNWTEILNRI